MVLSVKAWLGSIFIAVAIAIPVIVVALIVGLVAAIK